MPHARHALAVRARDGEIWAASRDDAASPASGSIRLGPPLRQKPAGQGVTQTERILSLRNVMHDLGKRWWCGRDRRIKWDCCRIG